jgi:N-acetylglutamate synthase-like GNAT family acetyltransferase
MAQWERGTYTIDTDPARIDLDLVHGFLTEAYWSKGIPRETVRRSIKNSLVFGVYQGTRQVGFARVVTDRATFAYVGDVFILPEKRGQGLAKWLMEVVIGHAELQGLRRWVLLTRDAHGLYRQVGFTELADPARYMEKVDPDVYRRPG